MGMSDPSDRLDHLRTTSQVRAQLKKAKDRNTIASTTNKAVQNILEQASSTQDSPDESSYNTQYAVLLESPYISPEGLLSHEPSIFDHLTTAHDDRVETILAGE
jgi:hypothetical protein